MSANLLTLNSYKTEFLIIGLKQQLSKIDSSSLNTTHSARNLSFIFDEDLTFSDQMNALNINSYHSPTKFLQPANLTTYTILSLFSLQVELDPRLLSP